MSQLVKNNFEHIFSMQYACHIDYSLNDYRILFPFFMAESKTEDFQPSYTIMKRE